MLFDRLNWRTTSDERPLPTVASTGERNTLTFPRGWSVGDEAAATDLLFSGPVG